MAHDLNDTVELPFVRLDPVPGGMKLAALVLTGLGLLALIIAFVVDVERAFHAYLHNYLFFTSVTHGAVVLAAVVTITKGLWSRPIRRISLSFVAFAPLTWLLAIPILFGADHIFAWLHIDLGDGPKSVWLTVPFMSARVLISLGALVAVELMFAYWALRPDLGMWRDRAPASGKWFWERALRGWRGQEAEEVLAYKKLSTLAVVLVLLYATAMSFIAFDFAMSLEPYWWSTLFGGFFFMGAFLAGIAATIVLTLYYRPRLGLEAIVLPTNLHDIGKLNFAFCIFWTYLFWAQFIVIWYGKLPTEQAYVIHRLEGGFAPISIAVLFMIFIIPFAGLLGVAPKKNPRILPIFSSIVLLGLWFERYLLTYPSLYAETGDVPFGFQEIGIGLFFAGLLLGSLAWFGARFPLVQHWQPLSEIELMGVEREAPQEAVTQP